MKAAFAILALFASSAVAAAQEGTRAETRQPYEEFVEKNGRAGQPSVLVLNADLGAC